MPTGPQTIEEQDVERIHAHLRGRNIVMIGMMGAAGYAAMVALAIVVEPTPREMSVRIPSDKMNP